MEHRSSIRLIKQDTESKVQILTGTGGSARFATLKRESDVAANTQPAASRPPSPAGKGGRGRCKRVPLPTFEIMKSDPLVVLVVRHIP